MKNPLLTFLDSENQKSLPVGSETRQGHLLLPLLANMPLEGLVSKINHRRESKGI